VVREPPSHWPPPPRVVLWCGAIVSLSLCVVSYALYRILDDYYIPELDVDSEGSVGAWASSVALFSCALVLIGIAGREAFRRRAWIGLAAVFGYLSLDEMASLHEKFSDHLREALSSSGPLLHPWVIPATAAVAAGTMVFLPVLRILHRRTSGWFTIGGLLYFGGAIGFEVVEGMIAGPPGVRDLRYATIATGEELLEMLGITVFLAALARFEAPALAPDAAGLALTALGPETAGYERTGGSTIQRVGEPPKSSSSRANTHDGSIRQQPFTSGSKKSTP
jgi:hypothetical protein